MNFAVIVTLLINPVIDFCLVLSLVFLPSMLSDIAYADFSFKLTFASIVIFVLIRTKVITEVEWSKYLKIN